MSKCDYGCTSQDTEELCAECGHAKKHHLSFHPHICIGRYEKNSQSPSESCLCSGFKIKEKEND